MFRQLITSLKSYEKEFENWLPHHFLEAKSETLKKAIETSLQQEPTLEHFLRTGTEEEATALLELLREEVPMMTVATLKGILDTLYKYEALQETPSKELVRWYRAQGWKFPEFRFEKIELKVTVVESSSDSILSQQPSSNDGQPRDDSAPAAESGEGQEAPSRPL
jgi:Fe2+ or Zn2+ uptake regulation protein